MRPGHSEPARPRGPKPCTSGTNSFALASETYSGLDRSFPANRKGGTVGDSPNAGNAARDVGGPSSPIVPDNGKVPKFESIGKFEEILTQGRQLPKPLDIRAQEPCRTEAP